MRLLLAFIVTTTLITLGNYSDALAACSITVTNTNNSGPGSLRQAIVDANQNSDVDEICFSIGSGAQTINLSSVLDPIINEVYINGTSQPPGNSPTPLIKLNGSSAVANGHGSFGLHFAGNGSGSTVCGLVISRFAQDGIRINTSSITVSGNYIGTDHTGSIDEGNGGPGIGIFSGDPSAGSTADNNIIGGTAVADRNVISGNGSNGVVINAQNGGHASTNSILGNFIGTNSAGTSAIPNVGDGILLNHAEGTATMSGNSIGGTASTTPGGACTGACNLVSGNDANGIGLWHPAVTNTLVVGNYVGTNQSGTSPIRNGNIGIEVNESPNNTVGGTTPQERNIFSGNGGAGIFITGASSTGNLFQGNFIGTNSAGTAGVGNLKMGIGIGFSPGAIGANSNLIGGATGTTPGSGCAGSCNLISGNGENGILVLGSESFGHTIAGNYIGLNVSGSQAIGNTGDGIGLLNTPNTSIGSGLESGRNFIGANGSNGVIIAGAASTGNRIVLNTIGMVGLGNTKSGVAISGPTNVAILSNSIFFNGVLGIDLDNKGSTNLNDPGDSDSGANRLQNFPEVYAAETRAGVTKVGGQFSGTPNSNFLVEFFYSTGCNAGAPRNYGQGQSLLGSISISTDQFGNTSFGYTPSVSIPGNTYLTATATRTISGIPSETSEFSKCVLVNAAKPALTNGATWYLKDYLTPGSADKTFGYGLPAHLLMCAWDANQPGVKLPVVVVNSTWFMRASYTTGTADLTLQYGFPGGVPVCGDWDGDGIDTPGLAVDGSTQKAWFMRNSNSTGVADITFSYGPLYSTPVVGDWDGNGTDTIGMAVGSGNTVWYLRNDNSSGPADAANGVDFILPGKPVVGDWDGNGTDTLGIVSTSGMWSIRNSNDEGFPNGSFQFNLNGGTPIIW